MRRVRLALDEPIAYGAVVDVTTRVVGVRRFWAQRENVVRDPTGRRVGVATTEWIFTDTAGHPGRIPQEMERAFPVAGPRPPASPIRFDDLPGNLPPSTYVVPAHQLDPAGHMNNAAYLDLFEDALAGLRLDPQERPALYAVEYLKPVAAGDTLERFAWETPSGPALTARVQGGATVVQAHRHSSLS